jgi:hypothetical protein
MLQLVTRLHNNTDNRRRVFYVVRAMPIARQRICKHAFLIEERCFLCGPFRGYVTSFCLATGYGLDEQEVGVRARIFTSPYHPNRLWDPPNLRSNWYRRFCLRGYSGQGVKLITHLQLVPRSRKYGSIHSLPDTLS